MEGIYEFDDVGDALEFMPTAARRALDVSGLKISLRAWQAMDKDTRVRLVEAGACAVVEPSEVALLLASSSPERIEPIPDPDPTAPPEGIDRARWAALRPLDRYALVKASKKPEKLARARAEILGNVDPIR